MNYTKKINKYKMENNKIKCSSKEDKDIDAISYCGECKIYICNKCEKFHKKLFSEHQVYNLDKSIEDIYTGFCKELNHSNKLIFFCKNHNTLCCAACLCKIEKDGNGLHKDCDVCLIEDVKNEKKDKIESNIKYLEEISNNLNNSINDLKIIFERIIKNKEEIKLNIQKIFTIIRNILNNREDELLLEVDKIFDNIYFDEKIIKQSEKLPNKVKSLLEKSKNIELKNDNLALFINECIEIEKNINDINKIDDIIKRCKNLGIQEIKFDDSEKTKLIEKINIFGSILIENEKDFDSSILNNKNNKKLTICNWIKHKINKSQIKFEKIFTMSLNGNTNNDFHKYCDKKGPTLTLIKTKNNKIFGGFTPLDWEEGNDLLKIDKNNQTFIFSLDLMKKYDMMSKEKVAIYCCKENGPIFGASDFNIYSNMIKGVTYANKNTNFLSNNNLELTGGKGDHESLDIEDFEVFKIIY